jgi:bacteriocin-like protein
MEEISMSEKKTLNMDEMKAISGGQNVFNYYGKQLFCSCGCGDFTCLGWKERPSGNCTAGYEFSCNYCGKTFINYVR